MIGMVITLALAQAATPETLRPEGHWTLDDQRGCTLSRPFASPAGTVTLGITPNIGAPGGELVLVLPGRGGRYEADEGRIVVNDATSFTAVWSRVGRRDQTYNGVTVQPADGFWPALAQAKQLTIDVGKRRQVRLDTGSMTAAVAALDKCRADKAALAAVKRR